MSRFKWWRRLIGGSWYYNEYYLGGCPMVFWERELPRGFGRIIREEHYA